MSTSAGEESVSTGSSSGQCQYTVPRKKRLCRMTVRPGRRYCGEHDRPDPGVDTSSVEGDARIPCPLDPKHTCYSSKLEKHLRVCNARSSAAPAYIREGCNSNGAPAQTSEQRVRLKDVALDKLKLVIGLVERLYSELVASSIQSHAESEGDAVHAAVSEDYELEERGRTTRRHLRQTSSLLHALQREGLVRERTCYVELGAGKGHVSYYLSRAVREVPSSSVLLVDRASHRHKQDNKLDPSRHRVRRIRADIGHLLLAEVDEVRTAGAVVAVTKHLCGVATDFALRCVTAPSVLEKTRGVVMATCCHHRCTADGYVAWDFLQEKGITREYFDIMMGIVSWATCGTGYSRERRSQELQQSDSKRQKLTTDNVCHTTEQPEVTATVGPEVESERKTHTDNLSNGDTIQENGKSREISSGEKLPGEVTSDNESTMAYVERDCDTKEKISEVRSDSLNKDSTMTYVKRLNLSVDTDVTDVKGLGLTVERRTEIGRRAKAVLDYGRTVYLKGCGFDTKLCYYVDVESSPENVCIIAKK